MDGTHDIGGRQNFGPICIEPYPSSYHGQWEKRINAVSGHLIAAGVYNMDERRHATERISGPEYMNLKYWERAITAIASLCREKGILDQDTIRQLEAAGVKFSLPVIGHGRESSADLSVPAAGEGVAIKDEHVPGHTRCPAYIRGKEGVVVREAPICHYPDASAHGKMEYHEHAYDIEFHALDLWGNDADANASNHVGVFRSYFERKPKE